MGAHVHMLAQLSDLSSLKCWATNFVKYNLSCWLRIWVLYYSLARILCYSSYSYTQILDSNNGTL